ncbi:MAG: MFS transporter [Bacteroides sp.]|nr:MFS transporter [Bacteroides sp.]
MDQTTPIETSPAPVREKLITSAYIWSFLSSFLMFFAFYLLLPVLPMYLADQFHAGKSLVGIILSSYTITALLVRPFAGYLVDSLPRKLLLVICYTVFVAFFGGYMLAATVLCFSVLRALHGMAFGLVTISNSTVAVDVMPSSRRNEGIGYYALSTNIAMAIGPMGALYLYDLFGNYPYIFLTSFLTGVAGICCVLMIRTPRRQPVKREALSFDRFFLVKGLPCAWLLTLLSFSYGILTTYVAIYGTEEVGLGSGTGFFFIIMALGLVLSRLTAAPLMNRGQLTKAVWIGILLMLGSYTMFIFLKTALFFYLSALLLGIAYGYVCPAFQAMFINLAHHNQWGTANSTYYISWDLGIGVGVLVGGQIADIANYTASYIAGLILVVIGLAGFRMYVASYYQRNKLR